jgi:hypothetical protein
VSRGVVTRSTLGDVLAASNVAFFVLFGIFVIAMVVLTFITLRWVIRRDKAGRQAWLERKQQGSPPTPPNG